MLILLLSDNLTLAWIRIMKKRTGIFIIQPIYSPFWKIKDFSTLSRNELTEWVMNMSHIKYLINNVENWLIWLKKITEENDRDQLINNLTANFGLIIVLRAGLNVIHIIWRCFYRERAQQYFIMIRRISSLAIQLFSACYWVYFRKFAIWWFYQGASFAPLLRRDRCYSLSVSNHLLWAFLYLSSTWCCNSEMNSLDQCFKNSIESAIFIDIEARFLDISYIRHIVIKVCSRERPEWSIKSIAASLKG